MPKQTDCWLAGVLALLVVGSATVTARAQSDDDSALVHDGIELRRRGEDQEALVRFQRAWEMGHRPIAQAQMGLALQALGRWIEAERALRSAMGYTSDTWIQRNRSALEGAYTVIQQHVGTLDIRGGASGARVSINGTPVATLPLQEPIQVLAGTVTIDVAAEGYYTESRRVIIDAGQASREVIDLRPLPPRGERAASSPSHTGAVPPATDASERSTSGGVSVPAIVLVVAGVVMGAIGIGVGVGPVQSLSHGGDMGLYNAGVGSEYALFVLGAAAIIGGVIIQARPHEQRHARMASPVRLGIAPSVSGATLWLQW